MYANKKGNLKIFFGYSAGTGKTYAMLKAAQDLFSEGQDVVIGYVEPHFRPDTIKMTEGLPTIPLKTICYKGITIKEFDVDEALKRKPQLLLVDELAHTNAPGSKNKKRYLDVEELINNGIDVWTTVNVQHIEGLHDCIDSAISVDVNERIPDKVFDFADEVILIDIEPTDLIERMNQGKIYLKTQAKTALKNFFNTENLLSLRELFMRRGAERIEKQGNFGQLLTKVLVLISPSPSSAKNIRFAARMAEAYHCKYLAMYVETNGELNDESATNLKKHMQLVKDTGGELIVKYGDDIVEIVANYVRLSGVTDLIIGKTWRSAGKKIGLEDKFISQLPELAIIIIPDKQKNYCNKQKINQRKAFFGRKKMQEQFRTANKVLDIINLITKSAKVSNNGTETQEIAKILSLAFKRSCMIWTKREKFIVKWQDENIDFFNHSHEVAVADWCKKNGSPAGIGTDSLRESKAIYFPISYDNNVLAVVAFSCLNSKMTVSEKIIFYQLISILEIVLQ